MKIDELCASRHTFNIRNKFPRCAKKNLSFKRVIYIQRTINNLSSTAVIEKITKWYLFYIITSPEQLFSKEKQTIYKR